MYVCGTFADIKEHSSESTRAETGVGAGVYSAPVASRQQCSFVGRALSPLREQHRNIRPRVKTSNQLPYTGTPNTIHWIYSWRITTPCYNCLIWTFLYCMFTIVLWIKKNKKRSLLLFTVMWHMFSHELQFSDEIITLNITLRQVNQENRLITVIINYLWHIIT